MLEEIFVFLREGWRNFLKKYMPFCQNESKMFCLIGYLLVSCKSLILEPCLILEKCLIVNSEILLKRCLMASYDHCSISCLNWLRITLERKSLSTY